VGRFTVTPAFGPQALIAAAFARCKLERRAAFIPFLVAGDPEADTSGRLVLAAAQNGADIIELGIPFSDPLADGPVIASAGQRALRAGMTFGAVLALARGARKELGRIPLVAFSYYNVVLMHGIESVAASLAASGFSGVVVPDIPFEAAQTLLATFARFGLAVPLLVAPTTPAPRAQRIAAAATGFVYVVSRMGVTGTHNSAGETKGRIAALRATSDKPIAVGFGVSSVSDVRAAATHADGVIVGSGLIEHAAAAETPQKAIDSVGRLCAEFAAACAPPKTIECDRKLAR
jgi:tryptophan synthase alpha chain